MVHLNDDDGLMVRCV